MVSVSKSLSLSLLCFVTPVLLSACAAMTDDEGVFRDRKLDYRKVEETSRMQVPENLDDDAIIDLYVVPPLSPYADKDYIYDLPLPNALIVGAQDAVTIQSLQEQQWILVTDSPSRLWPRLKQYLSLNRLLVVQEKGAVGMIEARSEQGFFVFKVEQGFQRNTSEIYIRQLSQQQPLNARALPISDSVELEKTQIEALSQFLADVSDKPAYSYVARGISAQRKMRELQDKRGIKSLLLEVEESRARASLLAALERAEFKVLEQSAHDFYVQYHPALPESEKPGFWGRLFGKDPDTFDTSVPYAGEFYRLKLTAEAGGQKLVVKPATDKKSSVRNDRNEINQIIQIVKGHLS